MSANQLPDAQTAYDTVIGTVHAHCFLKRMEKLGHVARTEEEAGQLVELGFKVAELTQQGAAGQLAQPQEKSGSVFAEASLALDKLAGVAPPPSNDALNVAMQFAQDSNIYASTLVLKHAEAQALASETE